jgi:murein DD-endopeptidase MepM/ murein hydrolase activator NlpD
MAKKRNNLKKWLAEIMIMLVLTMAIIGGALLMLPGGEGKGRLPATESTAGSEPIMAYGIVVDSLEVVSDRIGRNEFLADILLRYGVDYSIIDKIARSPRELFDARKIRAGNDYTVITTLDSVPVALYFIYEQSPTQYVVFDLRDTLSVYKGEKEVVRKMNRASGTITSSLWNALVENGDDPNLANELSEIFAWTIDFFGIRNGDHYKVIYDKLYVEEKYVGLGRVYAAYFGHAGHDFYACYFEQDSTGDYFDEEGGSMRRTFLKAPLRYRRVSSGFSYSRMHPVLKYRRPHLGVDYAAPAGTPVLAIGDGVVTFAAWTREGGYTVKIKHNGTYSTSYCHFSGFAKGIKQGVHVKQGQVIGYVGSTGLATGPHLDFRFYRNGQAIDPLKVKSPPAEPVGSAYLDAYRVYCDSLVNELAFIRVLP